MIIMKTITALQCYLLPELGRAVAHVFVTGALSVKPSYFAACT